jgi:hypothetical protein
MASNPSAQTRGLSAGDWIRLQRLRGARSYLVNAQSNKDINPPTIPQTPYNPSLLIPRHTGVSRIQRPASDWISYVGSQTADYVLQEGTTSTDTLTGRVTVVNGKQLISTRLCDCTNTILNTRTTGCKKCSVYIHKTMN